MQMCVVPGGATTVDAAAVAAAGQACEAKLKFRTESRASESSELTWSMRYPQYLHFNALSASCHNHSSVS